MGIYLYLRQQKKDVERKFDQIIANLSIAQHDLLSVKESLERTKEGLDRNTKLGDETRQLLLVKQNEFIDHLLLAQLKLNDYFPRPKDPELAQRLRARGLDID